MEVTSANPWDELPDKAPWIAPVDREVIGHRRGAAALRLDLMPEPYVGGSDPSVVVLMKAPGVADDDAAAHRDPDVQRLIRDSHDPGNGIFHPLEPEMRGTPTERYWREALRCLLDKVGEDKVRRSLLIAQACSYHAGGSNSADTLDLPSTGFTRELVLGAARRGALVVLVNGRAGWRETTDQVPSAQLVQVKNPRAKGLTPGNLGEATYRRILGRLDESRPVEVAGRIEGGRREVRLSRYERDRALREACLAKHGRRCCVCGFDFRERYGAHGEGFIHVHHLQPLGDGSGERRVDPEKELRPVCPNCHAMLHRGRPPLTPDELRSLLQVSD